MHFIIKMKNSPTNL